MFPEALKDFLDKSGVSFKEKRRSYILDCPRCQGSGKLWILKQNGYFVCWKCKETDNFKGRVEYALSEIVSQPVIEIQRKLYGDGIPEGIDLDISFDDFHEEESPVVIEEIEWPFGVIPFSHPAAQKGKEYLRSRGIPSNVASYYNIHYWPAKRRVMFPVEVGGKLVGYQGRAIFPTDGTPVPKILTSEGLRREHVLMFQDQLGVADPLSLDVVNHAILCEGPVDAIKTFKCGGGVATMGKAVSRPQLDIIRNAGVKKVYVALDPDAADEIARLAWDLGDLKLYLLLPPAGKKDLGECSFDEVYEAFMDAKPLTAGHPVFDLQLPRFA